MAPKIRAEKVHKDYLESLAQSSKFRVGFLLGIAENISGFEGIIVHMAPMPYDEDEEKCPESILDVDTEEMVLQAINLTRMLPGCFTVMGLFVVNAENVLQNDEHKKKLLQIVKGVQDQFRQNPFLHASQGDEKNFLMLVYSPEEPCVCQQIQKGKAVDVEFAPKSLVWRTVEPTIVVEKDFKLEKIGDTYNLEGNMQKILNFFSHQIDDTFVVRPREHGDEVLGKVQEEDLVDMLFSTAEEADTLDSGVQFLMKNQDDVIEDAENIPDGTVHLTGKICTYVFVPSKTKLREVEKYIRKDFMRTLATRLQLYCDVMAVRKIKMENLVNLHSDTPRRIFFNIQPTGVLFSDYLFMGENDDIIRENVKKLMDIDLEPTDIHLWAEDGDDDEPGLVPADEYDRGNSEEENRNVAKESFKYIAVSSLIAVIFSIYIMFFWKPDVKDFE